MPLRVKISTMEEVTPILKTFGGIHRQKTSPNSTLMGLFLATTWLLLGLSSEITMKSLFLAVPERLVQLQFLWPSAVLAVRDGIFHALLNNCKKIQVEGHSKLTIDVIYQYEFILSKSKALVAKLGILLLHMWSSRSWCTS
ncbi:hypothetical protein ACLB2K_034251 [Fragaria x ananassa]